MNRDQVHGAAIDACANGRRWIWFLLRGDPSGARTRLFTESLGPKGFNVGNIHNRCIVRFNSQYVMEYLDEASKDTIPYDVNYDISVCAIDDVRAHSYDLETLGEP